MDESVKRLLVSFGVALLFFIVRSIRQKKLESNDFVEVAYAIGGSFLILSLFVKAVTDQKLLDLIGLDELLALFVGTGTQIISSFSTELRQDCIFLSNQIKRFFS